MRALRVVVGFALVVACQSGPPADPALVLGSDNGDASAGPPDGGDAGFASSLEYRDIRVLHDQAMARTCSLNNGVCHNSREYPDLHTVDELLGTIGKRCDVLAARHEDVHDPCEPSGDHLVVPSLGIDAEIARLEIAPPTFGYGSDEIYAVTVDLATEVDAPAKGASDLAIVRDDATFPLGAVEHVGVAIASAASLGKKTKQVLLDLSQSTYAGKVFFDDRRYPWQPSFVRVADMNANGVLGRTLAVSIVTPGKPLQSYAILRLVDPQYGDLMPKQCRTWDDRATRALGCWIEGLKVGADGQPTNADDPIDYATCTFKSSSDGKGRCSAVAGASTVALFAQRCGGSSCHVDDASPPLGLDLSAAKAYASLVGKPSKGAHGETLVVPGDPDKSYLLCKLDPACAARVGGRMPLGADALDDFSRNALRTWIANGAPQD